jgi:hypothetical protein
MVVGSGYKSFEGSCFFTKFGIKGPLNDAQSVDVEIRLSGMTVVTQS